ncbi:MAG: hypothetical protein DYH02_12100 [Candidatus Omnitrophica bacterium COP1]|nr:hypothetical protein [Candidatus Omnitrophica bacterium COP1]
MDPRFREDDGEEDLGWRRKVWGRRNALARHRNWLEEPDVGATFMAPENPNPQTVILAKAGIYSRCHWIPAFAGKTMEGVGMAMEGSGNAERPSPPAECVERACCRGDIHGARKSLAARKSQYTPKSMVPQNPITAVRIASEKSTGAFSSGLVRHIVSPAAKGACKQRCL